MLLQEDGGFGGRFTPPETAGTEHGTCVLRGRLADVSPGASAQRRAMDDPGHELVANGNQL